VLLVSNNVGGNYLKNAYLLVVIVFAIGWLSSEVYSSYVPTEGVTESGNLLTTALFAGNPKEQISPYDWIKEDQIHVYNDRVTIYIDDPEWASFTDTNSMDPIIDDKSNAIEIVPKTARDIHIGDIVSYDSEYADGTIIHRVVETGYDEDGWYAVMKGDNLSGNDPGKVRFDQIKRVLVGILY